MKNLAVIFTFLFAFAATNFVQAQAQEDAISKYFEQYVDDERFTVVYISPKMFELFGRMELDLDMEDEQMEAITEVVKELKSLRILVAEEDADGLFDEAISAIDTKEYEVLMEVRAHEGEKVKFLVKDEGDIINELLLMVGGTDEFVLMSFVGNIDLANIGKLANAFEGDDDDEGDDEDYK